VDGLRVLSEERLPPRLADLGSPPQHLYLRGELPRGPAVAIVGTRYPSAEAVAFTRGLSADLASQGVAVLSGGAEGIDTAAHEGALDVGGVTVVVAPAGFNRPFPEKNAELFRRVVASGGAYLSLRSDDVPADQPIFFARNACLVALSHAVVVTQLGFRSGAANAAKWARELGRPLFIVPHSPWVTEGVGAVRELRLGGRPLDRAKEVLKLLSEAGLHPLRASAAATQAELWPAATPPGADPVLAAVRQGASHADEIADRTGLSLAAVQQRLLTLALSGVLVPGPLGSLKLATD
ncbi:MAG TPA: DNA-processing protein DprA, partial [Polyangiaceae bacterium]|nr:DNA-processing protein DprA [Polyangiaceae bacterium]